MIVRTLESVTLQVWATGDPVLSYQWYKGVDAILGAVNDTYVVIMDALKTKEGTYSCVVGTSACSLIAESDPMEVTWTNRGRLRQNLFMTYMDMNDIA